MPLDLSTAIDTYADTAPLKRPVVITTFGTGKRAIPIRKEMSSLLGRQQIFIAKAGLVASVNALFCP
jgi:hypothetical protein